MQSKVNVGAGYRQLEVGERIIEGDEILGVWNAGEWTKTNLVGDRVTDGTFRRKVPADTGIQLNASQTVRLKAILNWTVNTSGVSVSSRALRDELFPQQAPAPKKYRLLVIGEISKTTDEFFSVVEENWVRMNVETATVQESFPIRREIEYSYTGGPA